MAKFLRHLPCPKCGSRDNLGEYDDGSLFCFGCRYYYPGKDSLKYVKQKVSPGAKPGGVPPMPEDVSTYIPEVPYSWLKKALTDEEILRHRIGWSQERSALVFPVFDNQGNLLMWQSRYFGDNKDYPKYLTKGLKGDILHMLGNHPSDRIVVVEDLLSAIAVSRVENSMPLWGSTINLATLTKVARYYKNLAIWLDSDKLSEAVKARGIATLLFNNVEVISTEADPKYQTQEQLEKILGNPLDKRDQS